MDRDTPCALALRELDDSVQVGEIGVHAAGRHEAHEMERASLADGSGRGAQLVVLEERPVGDRVVDAHELLVLDVARTHREVADLAVAHHAVGQSDGAAARLECRVRMCREEPVDPRRRRERDRVARSLWGDPPSVEHAEHDRLVRGHE